MAADGFWNNQKTAQATILEMKTIRGLVEPAEKLAGAIDDVDAAIELASEEETFLDEAEQTLTRANKLYDQFELATLFDEEHDHLNCFMKLQAGAGGDDAEDWTDMLLRMYLRYCERHEYKADIIELTPSDNGLKSATLHIQGDLGYGLFRNEIGVHRLVRISPFDAQARRQTSFASCDVVPEVDDSIDIELSERDYRKDTYCAGGKGGQHVNKTESAVRLMHIATGIVVQCQNERSQHRNFELALKELKSRLFQLELAKRDAELSKMYGDKGEIAWGNQIRSYVLNPYQMVKDHRTKVETANVDRVLDGDLDDFIEAYQRHRKGRGLKAAK